MTPSKRVGQVGDVSDGGEGNVARNGDAAAVVELLRTRGERVACAESLTGGGLCSALVAIAGASAVLLGGVVAYDNTVKHHVLGVASATLAATGAVTAEVAVAMATGVRGALGPTAAVWGVSTTGVAGPDPDPISGAAAGVVFIAVVSPAGAVWEEKLGLSGARDDVRGQTVRRALGLLQRAIESVDDPPMAAEGGGE